MFKFFHRLVLARRDVPPSPAVDTLRPRVADVPRYPPVDPGLPAAPVAQVMATQAELIERLRRVAGFDDASFQRHCLVPIERVACHVHLLPASACDHFAGAGGLLRFCLEMALYSRQAADGRLFTPPSASAELRRVAEPRWRHACFLAGLLAELHRPLSTMVVTDPAGHVWPACLGSLEAWLRDMRAERYHVAWQGVLHGSSGSAEAAMFGDILPRDTLAWLNEASPHLVAELFRVALGTPGATGSVAAVVAATRDRVLEVEAVTRRSRYGLLRLGHHLEVHLLDAIRARVASGRWNAESPGGPLRLTPAGLCLDWPFAASAIRDDLVSNGLPGVPLSATTLAEVLGRSGVLAPWSHGQWVWPPDTNVDSSATLRFADARAVLGHTDDPRAVAVRPQVARATDQQLHSSADRAAQALPDPLAELPASEARLAHHWREALGHRRVDLLDWLPDGGLAISQELLMQSGTDLLPVASLLERRRWLGRGDWPAPHARAGLMTFNGTRKAALVVNEAGIRALGLRPARAEAAPTRHDPLRPCTS